LYIMTIKTTITTITKAPRKEDIYHFLS
jgi:hypothetical protein